MKRTLIASAAAMSLCAGPAARAEPPVDVTVPVVQSVPGAVIAVNKAAAVNTLSGSVGNVSVQGVGNVANATGSANGGGGGRANGGTGNGGNGTGGSNGGNGGNGTSAAPGAAVIGGAGTAAAGQANGGSGSGGGIGGAGSAGGVTTLVNSLLSGSVSHTTVSGPISDGGHNICSDASANFTLPSSRNNLDPLLWPLADNVSDANDGPASRQPSHRRRGCCRLPAN